MGAQQISLPKTTINITGANTTTPNVSQKVLMVGQKTASGSVADGSLTQNIAENQINALFGARSMLAQMCRAFKSINKVSQLDVIALDDNGAGVAADGVFTISGPATADGSLDFYVGSKIRNKYTIAISDTDTETAIGDALVSAITADTNAPFAAVNAAGVVTITAANDGTEGNFIGLKVVGSVGGVGVVITAFTGGATNPVLTTVFAPVANVRYQTIVYPASYGLTELKAFLPPRFNVDNKILDGVALLGATDTKTNLVTSYNSENEQLICVAGNKVVNNTDYKGSAIFELDTVIVSQFAAIRALRLTTGVSIANYVVGGTLDSFGGDAIRSLPYFNTPFDDLPLIETGLGFDDTEVSELKTAGVFVLGNNTAENGIIAGEVVTLYKTDSVGNPDISYKYLNYVDTISGIREYFFNNYKTRYAQTRLTEGELIEGRNMANENSIRAFTAKLYGDLSGVDYVLVQDGEVALKFFKDNLTVVLDLATGKVTTTKEVPIVTQLREIIATIKMSFTTN